MGLYVQPFWDVTQDAPRDARGFAGRPASKDEPERQLQVARVHAGHLASLLEADGDAVEGLDLPAQPLAQQTPQSWQP